jgi:hypothetical protein
LPADDRNLQGALVKPLRRRLLLRLGVGVCIGGCCCLRGCIAPACSPRNPFIRYLARSMMPACSAAAA